MTARVTATPKAKQMAITAAHGAAEKLAQDIVIIDVSDRLAITDCFVIASGTSDRQVQAIVDSVEEQLRLQGYKPARREGERDGRWVLLDYVDIVVHVQHTEERVFYALERLWRDCPTFPYEEGPDGANITSDDLVGAGIGAVGAAGSGSAEDSASSADPADPADSVDAAPAADPATVSDATVSAAAYSGEGHA